MMVAEKNIQSRNFKIPCYSKTYGQGKRATTILADQGDIVTVITDVPYTVRSKHVPVLPKRGSREMHRSTLNIPTQSVTDYKTTVQQEFGGSKIKPTPERMLPYPSQHVSQFAYGTDKHEPQGLTSYKYNFTDNGTDTVSNLRRSGYHNRLNMTEGSGMRESLTAPMQNKYQYWTRYGTIHNKLGAMLGTGVTRPYPVRRQYNPLTGEDCGSAWADENRRVSGNRVLYQSRMRDCNTAPFLG